MSEWIPVETRLPKHGVVDADAHMDHLEQRIAELEQTDQQWAQEVEDQVETIGKLVAEVACTKAERDDLRTQLATVRDEAVPILESWRNRGYDYPALERAMGVDT